MCNFFWNSTGSLFVQIQLHIWIVLVVPATLSNIIIILTNTCIHYDNNIQQKAIWLVKLEGSWIWNEWKRKQVAKWLMNKPMSFAVQRNQYAWYVCSQWSSDVRKCCALWASSFANSWASCRACLSGKCSAAFLVATASCFRRAHRWLLLHRRLWLDSPRWASLHRVSTNLWPTMITSLLCEMNFSGGWPSWRLPTNPLMAFWRAPK